VEHICPGKASGRQTRLLSLVCAGQPRNGFNLDTMKQSLLSFQSEDAPEDTTWSWSDSGWTKQGIPVLWFTESFLPAIGHERPQVLILDGHDSHNFIELIDTAIE